MLTRQERERRRVRSAPVISGQTESPALMRINDGLHQTRSLNTLVRRTLTAHRISGPTAQLFQILQQEMMSHSRTGPLTWSNIVFMGRQTLVQQEMKTPVYSDMHIYEKHC